MNKGYRPRLLIVVMAVFIAMCLAPVWACGGGGSVEERSLDAFEKEQQATYEDRLYDLRRNATPEFKVIFREKPDRVEVVEGLDDVIVYVYKDGAIFIFDRFPISQEYDYYFSLIFHPQYGYIDDIPLSMNRMTTIEEYGEVLYYLKNR